MFSLNARKSFSAKISLWVLAMSIPIFFMSLGLLFRQSRQMIRDEAVGRASAVLNASMQRVNRYLVTTETAAHTYSWKVQQSLQADSLQELTHRLVDLNPYVDGCAISMEPGVLPGHPDHFMAFSVRERDSIMTDVARRFRYLNKRWYQVPRDELKSRWLVYYDEANTLNLDKDGMIAAYSVPLFGADSTFVGVMSTAISLIHVSRIVSTENPYPHSYFFMVDEDGRYVGHPDTSRLFNKTIFTVANPQKQSGLIALGYEMTQGRQGQMSVEINGESSLVCYMPVPNTTWSLAIVCPYSDILKGNNTLTYVLLSLLIVGMFLIILNGSKAINYSLRPLRQLREQSQAIAEGDLEVDITHTERNDVVGRLQNSFATMLESLKENLDNVHAASREAQEYNSELEHTTSLVVEADKQKTQFMKNMTHQLRTPLNILVGFAQILQKQVGESSETMPNEEIKNIAQSMAQSSKQLNRLVLMLYDSSDKGLKEAEECDKEQVVNPNEVIRIVVNYIVDITPGLHIDIETEVSDDFTFKTNERLLAYSISEVIFNAVKYSDREHIKVRIVRVDSVIQFIVEDTGKGIAQADRERIFKFFTKVDDFSEGLGLGIPLSKSHALTLNGDFWLDTDYDKGCRFVFELPV
jgi:signal transduction histidine kinase